MRDQLGLLFSIVFLSLVFPSLSHADSDTEPLLFNVSPGGYPPYTIVHEDGGVSGIMWEILNRFAERQGMELQSREIPPRRVDGFLSDGRIDVTMRAREWVDHPENFVFSAPVLEIRDVLVSRAESPLEYRGPDSLEGRLVLAQLGFQYPVFDELVDEGRVERMDVQKETELLRRLRHGERFDAAIADYHVSHWVMAEYGWHEDLYISKRPVSVVYYRFAFRPGWEELVDQLNRFLVELRANGELAAIVASYR